MRILIILNFIIILINFTPSAPSSTSCPISNKNRGLKNYSRSTQSDKTTTLTRNTSSTALTIRIMTERFTIVQITMISLITALIWIITTKKLKPLLHFYRISPTIAAMMYTISPTKSSHDGAPVPQPAAHQISVKISDITPKQKKAIDRFFTNSQKPIF